MNQWNPDDTPDFALTELRCRCGCGRAEMDRGFMDLLQELRDGIGPMVVASGFRCPAHNARVSATGRTGPHTTGKAVDIQVCGHAAYRLMVAASLLGFAGLGVSQKGPHAARFLHLDTLDAASTGGLRPWLWSY